MRKNFTPVKVLLAFLFALIGSLSFSQVAITPGTTITQDFNSIGTTGTATLPTGWKIDGLSTVRLLGTYTGAGTATTQAGAASISSSAAGGIYNFGSSSNSSDRAVGGLSSSSGFKTVNVYADLLNTGAGDISGLTISYNIEKYRFGTNVAGYTVQLYYSTDGTAWTSAGSNFAAAFAADATTAGNATTPITTTAVSAQSLNVPIASGAHLYLAWSYSVSSGSTTSNAQGLGIDDVAINAIAATPATPQTTSISPAAANAGGNAFTLTVNGSGFINGLSTVTWNGAARTTSFVNSTQLTATIPASDIAATGSASVGVTTTGAVAVSNTQTFTINAAATPAFSLTAGSLAFGNVCTGTVTTPVALSFDGSNLDGSNIFIGALPGYLYSETAGGTYSNTLSFAYTGNGFTGKQVYVKFSPASVQSYNGSINITGGGIAPYTVNAAGAGINTAPAVATGSGTINGNTATLTGSITDAGCSSVTSYGFEYSNVSGFANGSGTQILGTNLSGTNYSAALTNLSANNTYYYKAFAVNAGGITYGSQQSVTVGPIPVPMAAQPLLTYTEDFSNISSWGNSFASGTGAGYFSAVAVNNTGTIPDGIKITTNNVFSSGTSGGVQKGSNSIVLLSTGSPDNTTSAAFDLSLDFTGVNAGTLSFDWSSINNSTGDRNGSLRVYASSNGGVSFTELSAAAVLNFTNNAPTNGSVASVALPLSFNNNLNARLRFYYSNGTGGTTGSRPKIGITNINVSAISNTPCATPAAPATALVFGTVSDVSVQGSFTASSPAANEYLIVMSTNSSLTSNPVDGQVYAIGDNVGDGSVIARGPATTFTATGLSGATTYYFFIFPVNSVCLGGPKYLTANVLNDDVTTAAGLPPCTAPAAQVTNLILSNITVNSISGNFTATTADEYLVLKSTSASLSTNPVNGQVYNIGDALGNATVVQRGGSTNFIASGLNDQTTYYFFVFSIGSSACLNGPAYNTTAPLTMSAATLPLPVCATPLAQPSGLSFTAANNKLSGTFNAPAGGDAYLVIMSNAPTLFASPADNTNYNPGDVIGGGTVVTTTTANSFTATGLNSSTTYYFYVFAASKTCTGGIKYLTAAPLTGNATTTNAPVNNYYFGTLHSHSDYSDGNKDHPGYTPTDDYNYALGSQGMDFLGISEHNHFSSPDNPGTYLAKYHSGIAEANAFTTSHPGFLALYGMEWGVISGGGHVVVYGDGLDQLFGWESNVGGTTGPNYDVFVPKSTYTGPTGLFKNINDNAAKNAFATLAHPNSTDYNNIANIAYDSLSDQAIVGSAVESGPATSTNTSYSNPASSMSYLGYFQKMLAKGYHLGPVIDHDNHNTTFGRTTRARTAVIAPALTQTEIIKAMRDMHFYATEDYDSKVDFNINTRMMGSVFSDRNAPSISVTLSDATTNTSNAVIKIMFGIPGSGVFPVKIDSIVGNTLSFVDNDLPVNATGYYYADITNAGSRIITSPIWYTRTCSITVDTTVAACGSFSWAGTNYTASGSYTRNYTSTGGCDSIVTLHLTINHASTGDTTATACSSFTWYDSVYTASGNYMHTVPNVTGCDSVITLHLTINQPGSSDTTATACSSFTWYGTTYTTSGTYAHTAVGANGCDSIITLHLAINAVPAASITASGNTTVCPGSGVTLQTTAAAGVNYQWLNGGVVIPNTNAPAYTATTSGLYSVRITNTNQCSALSDSIRVTIADTIAPVPDTAQLTVVKAACAVSVTAPTATDNCAGKITATTMDATSFTQQGTYTIHWTYQDGNGNSSVQTQTVVVKDSIAPVVITKPITVTLVNGTAVITPASVDNGSSDNCGIATMSLSKLSFNCSNIGNNTVTLTVKDVNGNIASAPAVVTVSGQLPTVSVTAVPQNNTYTGGVPTNIYLGYGPQSVTLNATATGNGDSYLWSGNGSLSNTTSQTPVFAPTASGYYIFTVVVTNENGCTASASISICVKDIRVPGSNGKVYITHNGQTLSVSTNAVPAHLSNHAGDRLGAADQQGGCTVSQSDPGSVNDDDALQVNVNPNPSSAAFKMYVISSSNDKISVVVSSSSGSVVKRFNTTNGAITNFGEDLRPGVYFVEVTQGKNKKTVKVIKL